MLNGWIGQRGSRGGRLVRPALGLFVVMVVSSCGLLPGSDSGEPDAGGPKAMHTSLRLNGVGGEVGYDAPVQLAVPQGTIDTVAVTPHGGEPVAGAVGDGGSTWSSDAPLDPGGEYAVKVVAADRFGEQHTLTGSFTVAGVPDGNRLTLTMQPADGTVVGVGAPITVKFDQQVTEKAAVEKAMHVSSSPQVEGSWRWLSSTEAHFRPKEYWPTGAKVQLNLDLNGVKAGDDLWGGRSYELDFTVGTSRITTVDAATHTMTVAVDGKPTATWNTSLGQPEFATRNGTYIVLEKFDKRQMTSCNANITCDPGNPDYYDLEVSWSTRLTWSGTFVHAAPWSEGSQGLANVSHGCINLSGPDGKTFFDTATYGDIVIVVNSSRDASDLVQRGDPGMADWNLSWDQHVAGSALGEAFTTSAL